MKQIKIWHSPLEWPIFKNILLLINTQIDVLD